MRGGVRSRVEAIDTGRKFYWHWRETGKLEVPDKFDTVCCVRIVSR